MHVWDEDHIVFADICSPQTVRKLLENPAMEINVVDPMLRKGYRFKGTAEVFDHGDLFERVVAEVYEAFIWKQHERIPAVVLVTVAQVRPLVSPAYDQGRTEAEVIAT